MIKGYHYHLISKYISVYVRPGDKVLFIEPKNDILFHPFSPEKVLIFTNNPEQFSCHDTTSDTRFAGSWKPDYIILDGNLQRETDVIVFLETIHSICTASTRIILTYYSILWKPLAKFAMFPRMRAQRTQNTEARSQKVFDVASLQQIYNTGGAEGENRILNSGF